MEIAKGGVIGEFDFQEVAALVAFWVGFVEEGYAVEGLVEVACEVDQVAGEQGALGGGFKLVLGEDFAGLLHDVHAVGGCLCVVYYWDGPVVDVWAVQEMPVIPEAHPVGSSFDVVGPHCRFNKRIAPTIAKRVDRCDQAIDLLEDVRGGGLELYLRDCSSEHMPNIPPAVARRHYRKQKSNQHITNYTYHLLSISQHLRHSPFSPTKHLCPLITFNSYSGGHSSSLIPATLSLNPRHSSFDHTKFSCKCSIVSACPALNLVRFLQTWLLISYLRGSLRWNYGWVCWQRAMQYIRRRKEMLSSRGREEEEELLGWFQGRRQYQRQVVMDVRREAVDLPERSRSRVICDIALLSTTPPSPFFPTTIPPTISFTLSSTPPTTFTPALLCIPLIKFAKTLSPACFVYCCTFSSKTLKYSSLKSSYSRLARLYRRRDRSWRDMLRRPSRGGLVSLDFIELWKGLRLEQQQRRQAQSVGVRIGQRSRREWIFVSSSGVLQSNFMRVYHTTSKWFVCRSPTFINSASAFSLSSCPFPALQTPCTTIITS